MVELRLDKFGGVVKSGKDGYAQSGWSRINLHVIFDQIEPDLIRQQFLAAISRSYQLVPGSPGEGRWDGVVSRENLEALGQAIIESVPQERRSEFSTPLKEGFNNFNISFDAVKTALQNHHLSGKYLIAIGKTEWEDLKWDDHTIAEKKDIINQADLVFTAAENPEAYKRGRRKLIDSNVNAKILDCSDAHWLKKSTEKDRIGNCFTWIKSDATFQGLVQAIAEYRDRVFVGDIPPKVELIDRNRTKFIKSVKVAKRAGATLREPWFDIDIPLNPDLVAIIGNKGSGKSALADIIALVGNTRNYGSFSFLNTHRFRNPRTRLAQNFEGTLSWYDGNGVSRELDKDPDSSSVERVKYLPQRYLEDLCNELGEGGSSTFDTELRKIIYSHVPEEDRLGQTSVDDLLAFKVAEISHARQSILREIGKANAEIVQAEARLAPAFERSLQELLTAKKAELDALEAAIPQVIEDPNVSPTAQEESKEVALRIDKLELELGELARQESAVAFAETVDDLLHHDRRDESGRETRVADQLRKGVEPQEILSYLYGFEYLAPRYSLTYDGQEIGQLSPGERGLLLLVFYLLVDKDDIPIVIDQPEENLDNQTIYRVLVKCIKKAKERRQVIMVTHNPNLAVVCDAEQIIHAHCDKVEHKFLYSSGAIENPDIKAKVVQILEGTEPAFRNRQSKYQL